MFPIPDTLFFNLYSLLYLAIFMVGAVIILEILRKGYSSNVVFWLLLFISATTGNALCQFFIATTKDTSISNTAHSLGLFTLTLTPLFFLYFALAFVGYEWLLRKYWFIILTWVSMVLAYIFIAKNLHNNSQLSFTNWGYAYEKGRWYSLLQIELLLYLAPAYALFCLHYYKLKDELKKRQVILILSVLTFTFTGGILVEVIVSQFLSNKLFPLSQLFILLSGISITITVIRYDVSIFNPITISSRILNTMNEIVIGLNTEYRIEFLNEKAEHLLGYKKDELLGALLDKIIAKKNDIKKLRVYLNDIGHHTKVATIDNFEILNTAQKIIPVNVSLSGIADKHGDTQGYILVMSDISKLKSDATKLQEQIKEIQEKNQALQTLEAELRKEKGSIEEKVQERTQALTNEQARLQASINNLTIGFIMTNVENTPINFNTAALQILNLKSITGFENFPELFNDKEKISLVEMTAKCVKEKNALDLTNISMNDKFLYFVISPILVDTEGKDKEVIGTVILIKDTTEDQLLERSREEFFSIASHELRTPLTAIRGYTAYIKQYHARELTDPETTEILDRIELSSNRLIEMVNDFLDASRLEQKRMQFVIEEVDLPTLIADIIKDYQLVAKEKNLELTFVKDSKETIKVYADANRVKQILINLLGNAMKFTEKGGVTVKLTNEDDKTTKIFVQDTGKGIPEETKTLLFRKFQQAGSSIYTRDSSGTGLGLYISKLLIEGMGGRIQLESSQLGAGTTFSFTLPTVKNK